MTTIDTRRLEQDDIDLLTEHHQKSIRGEYCEACSDIWPCPTATLLSDYERLHDGLRLIASTPTEMYSWLLEQGGTKLVAPALRCSGAGLRKYVASVILGNVSANAE